MLWTPVLQLRLKSHIPHSTFGGGGWVTTSHPLTFPTTPSHPLYYYYYFYDHVSWFPFLKRSTVQRKYLRMKNSALVEKQATRAPGKTGAHIFSAVIINRWNNELKNVTDSPTQCSELNCFFLKIFSGLMNFKLMVCYLSPVLKRPVTNPYLCSMKRSGKLLRVKLSYWVKYQTNQVFCHLLSLSPPRTIQT